VREIPATNQPRFLALAWIDEDFELSNNITNYKLHYFESHTSLDTAQKAINAQFCAHYGEENVEEYDAEFCAVIISL
jgi:hypothetical protein